jgi:hypothetical protein
VYLGPTAPPHSDLLPYPCPLQTGNYERGPGFIQKRGGQGTCAKTRPLLTLNHDRSLSLHTYSLPLRRPMAVLRVSWCQIPMGIFVYYISTPCGSTWPAWSLSHPAGSSVGVARPLGKWHWSKASRAGDGGVGSPPMGSKSAPQHQPTRVAVPSSWLFDVAGLVRHRSGGACARGWKFLPLSNKNNTTVTAL